MFSSVCLYWCVQCSFISPRVFPFCLSQSQLLIAGSQDQVVSSSDRGLPPDQGHVEAQLVIPLVAPAAISLAEFGLLDHAGHRQRDGLGVELARAACHPQHLLHFGDHLVRLAVALLVVDPTVEGRREGEEIVTFWI